MALWGGQRKEAVSGEKQEVTGGLSRFVRQEVGLCALENDPVEEKNSEMGVSGDNSGSSVPEPVRGSGLQGPGEEFAFGRSMGAWAAHPVSKGD